MAKGKTLPKLTLAIVCKEATAFAINESKYPEPSLYGVTDGKAVGTYLEQKFRAVLQANYSFEGGNSAKGIDFPSLDLDVKVTSIRQPQSSCPFKDARQKIFGLGYSLLIFVYDKLDDAETRTATLKILHVILVDKKRTADFQMTSAILQILANAGNKDDLLALFMDKNLPVDEITAVKIAEELLLKPPELGYLTISNALQWRLQYRRVIEKAGAVAGVERVS